MSNRSSFDSLPVIDATEPMVVEVETCDIESATPRDPGNCVAARAIRRQVHCGEAHVFRSRVYVLSINGTHWLRYQAPAALRDEEIAFDRGGRFEPQIITFPVLKPSSRTGQRQGSNATARTGRRRQPRRVLTGLRPTA